MIAQNYATFPTPNESFETLRSAFGRIARAGKAQRIRGISQFSAEEIVLVEGPKAGRKWRPQYQPFQARYFEAIDSGQFNKFVVTGNVQSGKSFCSFVVPSMWHLCERKESIILAAPTMDIARDKWEMEILPIFRRSRYSDLLPAYGKSSRGGFTERIDLTNGATLKFMSGHGGDEKRSSFTSRVVIITEANKMDTAGNSSKEASPIRQILARTEAYDIDDMVAYAECTVDVEDGFIWREYMAGTASTLVCPCPHCSEWVCPEKDDFKGIERAETLEEAEELGRFHCPACNEPFSDQQRSAAVAQCKLIHTGQHVDRKSGEVVGEVPRTRQLGFRWSAWHNSFWSQRKIAHDEYKAANEKNEDDAQKYQTQFVWVRPWVPPNVDVVRLDINALSQTDGAVRRGVMPDWADTLTVGIDVGKYFLHWTAIAWRANLGDALPDEPAAAIVDYDIVEVMGTEEGRRGLQEERAVEAAIKKLLAGRMLKEGFLEPGGGTVRLPDMVLIDAGYQSKAVRQVCKTLDRKRFFPIFGRGTGQHMQKKYAQPTKRGGTYVYIGDEFHGKWNRQYLMHEFEANVDYWKSWLIRRLASQSGPGSLALFYAEPRAHRTFWRHISAEEEFHEFDMAKNKQVSRWERVRKANHFFDCTTYACIAASYKGVRLLDSDSKTEASTKSLLSQLVEAQKRKGPVNG
jgi:phage terminase large subunit GpA-like protein